MPPTTEDIVVFYWGFSPWANKVITYLSLRGMPHAECDQPITLPRPDIAALGVNYRRIPVVAIGRDIFCDTLIIMQKLDELFPASSTNFPSLNGADAVSRAMDKLFEKWTDVVVFKHAADAIPSSLPLCQDPAFIKDRTELWGYDWSPAEQDRKRYKGLTNLRANFDLLEDILGDGRNWILNTNGPMLADIHAAWIFGWMKSLPEGLPEQYFPTNTYPKTHAWLDRYAETVQHVKDKGPKPVMLSGEEALKKVFGQSKYLIPEGDVQENDPLGLKKGQTVEVYATDTGFSHRDTGKLVSLTNAEVVIEKPSQTDNIPVRIHFPRWNFSITATDTNGVNGH